MPRIFIVTGEASGDLHGANLARAIYKLRPDVRVLGVGGQKMAEAGVHLVPGIERVDSIGVPGVKQLWNGVKTFLRLKSVLRTERFDSVVFHRSSFGESSFWHGLRPKPGSTLSIILHLKSGPGAVAESN